MSALGTKRTLRLQHLPRIEDAIRIERLFQRAHQFDRDGVLNQRQSLAFGTKRTSDHGRF